MNFVGSALGRNMSLDCKLPWRIGLVKQGDQQSRKGLNHFPPIVPGRSRPWSIKPTASRKKVLVKLL